MGLDGLPQSQHAHVSTVGWRHGCHCYVLQDQEASLCHLQEEGRLRLCWPLHLEQWLPLQVAALTKKTKGWPSKRSAQLGRHLDLDLDQAVDLLKAVRRRLAPPLPSLLTPARRSAWLPDTGGELVGGFVS